MDQIIEFPPAKKGKKNARIGYSSSVLFSSLFLHSL